MDDLVSRLLEAIAVKEEKAQWASPSPWALRSGSHGNERWADIVAADGDSVVDTESGSIGPHFGTVDFILNNDPFSVLRRCAADRKLVDLHGIVHRDIGWLEWDEGEHAEMYAELPVCGLCVPKHSSFPRRADVPEGPCRTVRILAEGYGLAVHQEGGDRG